MGEQRAAGGIPSGLVGVEFCQVGEAVYPELSLLIAFIAVGTGLMEISKRARQISGRALVGIMVGTHCGSLNDIESTLQQSRYSSTHRLPSRRVTSFFSTTP